MTYKQEKIIENYIRKVVISEITKKNRLNEGTHLSSDEVEFHFKDYNWQFVKPLFKIIQKVHDKFNIEYEFDWDQKKLWLNYDDFKWTFTNEDMPPALKKEMYRVIYELEKINKR